MKALTGPIRSATNPTSIRPKQTVNARSVGGLRPISRQALVRGLCD